MALIDEDGRVGACVGACVGAWLALRSCGSVRVEEEEEEEEGEDRFHRVCYSLSLSLFLCEIVLCRQRELECGDREIEDR